MIVKMCIGLDNLTGVAAILRYPLPDIDDIEEEDIDLDAEEEESKDGASSTAGEPKMDFDEEQMHKLFEQAKDELGEGEEEEEVEDTEEEKK